MSVEQTIAEKLTAALSPQLLEIHNESHHHQGHAGSPGTGESHFHLKIVSDGFGGKGRIERHRMVTDVLKAELSGPVHALRLLTLTHDEHEARRASD